MGPAPRGSGREDRTTYGWTGGFAAKWIVLEKRLYETKRNKTIEVVTASHFLYAGVALNVALKKNQKKNR